MISPKPPTMRWAPQVALVLDDATRVLNVNSALAGSSLAFFVPDSATNLHSQLHPGCGGDCRFEELWQKAWLVLSKRDSIEWELDDEQSGKTLRLNLSVPPTSIGVAIERRKRHALLTVTDITRFRREYKKLVHGERRMREILDARGIDPDSAATINAEAEEFRISSHHVIMAQEYERRRIASELHDGIAQSLGVIKYSLEAEIEAIRRQQHSTDTAGLVQTVSQVKALMDEVRRISRNLVPSALEDFGLCVAVHGLCDEFRSDTLDLRPTCSASIDESALSGIVKISVYRIVQEALGNIAKHASASAVCVSLIMDDDELRLVIVDDGVGFDTSGVNVDTEARGAGLNNMRDRALASGGFWELDTKPGGGVRIEARWSLDTCEATD